MHAQAGLRLSCNIIFVHVVRRIVINHIFDVTAASWRITHKTLYSNVLELSVNFSVGTKLVSMLRQIHQTTNMMMMIYIYYFFLENRL